MNSGLRAGEVVSLEIGEIDSKCMGFVTPAAASWIYVGTVLEGYEENQLRRISVPA